jgi:hypothetical protein
MVFERALAILLCSLGQMDDEFYQDFRGGASIHPVLVRFGAGSAGMIQQEAEGLRLTLPANHKGGAAVGVAPRFHLSGDFEITLGYEILSAGEPSDGLGAGVKIWGKFGSEDFQAMTVAHVIRPKEGNGFVSILAHEKGGKRVFKRKARATDVKKGRLRLARTGSELSFLVAEGEDETFEELQRVTVGTSDVASLRIPASAPNDPSELSIRLLDLRIRADDLPATGRKERAAWGWVVVWVLVIGVIGAGSFLLWRYQRGGKGSGKS